MLVHEARGPRQGHRIGSAVAGPAVDEGAAARGLGEAAREIAPQGDAAQPLVKEHEGGRVLRARSVPDVLEPVTAHDQLGRASLVHHASALGTRLRPPS